MTPAACVWVGLWVVGIAVAKAAPSQESGFSLTGAPMNAASQWREFNVANQMLVHESGSLKGVSIGVSYQCSPWQIEMQVAALQGQRVYQGQTNGGRAAMSQSSIRHHERKLQTLYEWRPGWLIGGMLTQKTLWRDIASASGAEGYPERFAWTSLSMGLQWQPRLGSGQLALTAWAGQALDANLRVSLPGKDTTALTLGTSRHMALAANWRTRISPQWHLGAGMDYSHTNMGQGPTGIVRRNGLPAGVAHQPKTHFTDSWITLRLEYTY